MATTSVSTAPAVSAAPAAPAVAAEAAPAVAPEAAVSAEAVTPEAVAAAETPVTKSVSPAADPVSYAVYAVWVIANGFVIANGTVTACQGQTGKHRKQAPPHSLRNGQAHGPVAVSARSHLATRSNTST
jgi:hypothetical protein